jgi:uncharacterized protein (TIGR03066 family)
VTETWVRDEPLNPARTAMHRSIKFAMAALTMAMVTGLSLTMAQEATAKKLVGTWVFVKGDAPPGMTLTFTGDGKLTMTAEFGGKEFKVEGTYEVKDNALHSKLSDGKKEVTEVHKIKKLTDTELHTEDPKGKVDEFKKK